jgi:hypothetical protein
MYPDTARELRWDETVKSLEHTIAAVENEVPQPAGNTDVAWHKLGFQTVALAA